MTADHGNDELSKDRAQPASLKRVRIGPLLLDPLSLHESVAWVLDQIETRRGGTPARICSPNAAIIAEADKDPQFAESVRSFELVVADGLPLVWTANLLGTPLGGQVRGVDLMQAVCGAAPAGTRVYILGGLPEAAQLAAARLEIECPGLRVVGVDCPPVGFEYIDALNSGVKQRIIAAAPHLLIVALGSPKQEWWIFKHGSELPVTVIQGVGAAIDTIAGIRERPPAWMQRLGLEWLGRLWNEPRRLWRRYLFGNARFLGVIFRQWLGSSRRGYITKSK
jgi:N-acetylglucosaminyldiphosphoundecaprenol N-acetyl-beta-D-mannosaminyltransferase